MDEKEYYEIEDTGPSKKVSSVKTIKRLESTEKTILEWIPAYYCEMTVLKSNVIDENFSREVYERLYKQKGHLLWKKMKIYKEL